MNVNSDHKPFDTVGGECLECGFHFWTETAYMSLDELNENREVNDLEPLAELPKQEEI